MNTVGIVSPGAMGSAVGHVLAAGGARVVATLEHRSARTAKLAEGIELLPSLDAVVEASQVVLSIVPPGEALAVAGAVADAASRTGARPTVADLNAIAPVHDGGGRRPLESAGLSAVDGSISGPPPRRAGATIVYLSGVRAAEVASLPAPGLEFRVVGGPDRDGLGDQDVDRVVLQGRRPRCSPRRSGRPARTVCSSPCSTTSAATIPRLVDDAPRMLQSIAAKSGRYVAEMREIAATQEEAGLTPDLFAALATVFLQLSETELARRGTRAGRPDGRAGGRPRVDRRARWNGRARRLIRARTPHVT